MMELLTETDVIHLANALAVKSGLDMKISSLSQCTSDFVLAVYLSIMGELPPKVQMESSGMTSQEHNIACVVDSLAVEYLHVDLSHILPVCFVAGDPTTVYNILEILDGLLDFMLEQIEINLDSGDEADVDSEITFLQTQPQKKADCRELKVDASSAIDRVDFDLSTCDIPTHDTVDREESSKASMSLQQQSMLNSEDKAASNHSGSLLDTNFDDCNRYSIDKSPRSMLIKSLRNAGVDGGSIIKEIQKPFAISGQSSDQSLNGSVSEVLLDTAFKGSGIIISDFTSESSKSDYEPQSECLLFQEDSEKVTCNHPTDGLDVADGIPKPDFHHDRHKLATDLPRQQQRPAECENRQWGQLFDNLQKTVEESKRIREKYFASPQPSAGVISDRYLDENKYEKTTFERDRGDRPLRKHIVHFKDTSPARAANSVKDFDQVLQQEQRLQNIKNKILCNNYVGHYEEVAEAERRRLIPLMEQTGNVEKHFKHIVSKQKKGKGSHSKKGLAAAAKWRSWQSETVVRKPRFGHIRDRGDERLVIGEHDLLPTLISEFPGLELSSTALNNAWRKQFRQIEIITKNQSNYALKKRLSEKKLEGMRNRHELLIEVMQKEHAHNERARDAKQRAASKQEASRTVKERRQQSACVRRYYRDYQLQMRARMLKRRTREEKLFKNLFEEGLDIQRSRLNDLRCYARDRRTEQQRRQRNEIESLENYYKDQFAMLAETLENEKKDLNLRNNAQTKLLRGMTNGLRHKMEKEITKLQEQIARDDDDVYFREVESDRVKRQLQLATYNVKFNVFD